jgi:hypothetical protein
MKENWNIGYRLLMWWFIKPNENDGKGSKEGEMKYIKRRNDEIKSTDEYGYTAKL